MERLTLHEAAQRLGISEPAVRKRAERGKLRSEKVDGRVYVWVDNVHTDVHDESEVVRLLKDEVAHLRRESERKDSIIMSLSQSNAEQARTIRELEAAPHKPQKAEEAPPEADEGYTPGEGPEGPQTATQGEEGPRPWWRRIFGG
jgi:excisionase family DNA binding protein